MLIVDDEEDRQALLSSWVPAGTLRLVSSGADDALRILRAAEEGEIGAVLLDYDLHRSVPRGKGPATGRRVAQALVDLGLVDVPVLVHSGNDFGREELVAVLGAAGFAVSAIPLAELTRDVLARWLAKAEAVWTEAYGS